MIKFFENNKFLLVLALINFLAGIYSINYYLTQLNQTNPLLWIFVIDCPLAAILFGIVLILRIKKINFVYLEFISIIANIKFGLWTLFILFINGFLISSIVLTLGHLLLLFEVIILFRKSIFRVKHFLIGLIWFLINDLFDYALGTHPFFTGNFEIVAIFVLISTFLVVFMVSIFFSGQRI